MPDTDRLPSVIITSLLSVATPFAARVDYNVVAPVTASVEAFDCAPYNVVAPVTASVEAFDCAPSTVRVERVVVAPDTLNAPDTPSVPVADVRWRLSRKMESPDTAMPEPKLEPPPPPGYVPVTDRFP